MSKAIQDPILVFTGSGVARVADDRGLGLRTGALEIDAEGWILHVLKSTKC